MKSLITIVSAIALLALAALGHGLRTDRWGVPADLQAAVAQLQQLPKELGDWTSTDGKLSDAEVAIAQIAGYLIRNYEHKYTQEKISIMILCGRPGPVAVHTPEICYAGAGFVPGPVEIYSMPKGGSLWHSEFVKQGAAEEKLRIHWAWSTNGDLIASKSPITDFGLSKALYKIYVIRQVIGSKRQSDAEPDRELLKILQPHLKKCLSLGT